MHASLALSSLLHVWYKPNSLNSKSIYNTLLLEFYICAKLRLTHWYPCPKKWCHYFCTGVYTTANKLVWLKLANVLFKQQRHGDQQRVPLPKLDKLITHELYNEFQTGCLRFQVTRSSRTLCCITRNAKCVQDCLLKKKAECTLAALEFLIAWEERLAFALVEFRHMIMIEVC